MASQWEFGHIYSIFKLDIGVMKEVNCLEINLVFYLNFLLQIMLTV